MAIDVDSGAEKSHLRPQFEHGDWASCLALDKAGNIYVGIRGEHHHVLAYNAKGELQRQIGRVDGRALIGPWTKDGMYSPSGIAVDSAGKLWVAEDDGQPRRVSVWNTADGTFNMELFGASSYGATGCIVDPKDPYRMVGMGCEWRIDPKTAKAECLGTITRDGMGACRYGFGKDGRQYLAVTPTFLHGPGDTTIYERLGDANYKLRSSLKRIDNNKKVEVWADANDDAQRQDNEVKTFDIDLGGWINGWYMSMSPDLSFYGSLYQLKVTDWTACGAPVYDIAAAKKLPAPTDVGHRGGMGAQRGHGSADGRYMLWNGGYGLDHATVDCYDIATGKLAWKYPSNFTGVHGSHRACGPETGMIRGAYDICGVAKLPDPIGNIWIIPTNKGEWHVLTEKGFYLTKLFESDPTTRRLPRSGRARREPRHLPAGRWRRGVRRLDHARRRWYAHRASRPH